MRRVLNVFISILFLQMLAIIALAQQDKLAGRWEGKIQSMQGERPTTATFKKEGDGYSGSIVAMQRDLALKDIKVDGDKVTAIAQVETPQATIEIKYSFTLSGDTMKGKGELEFGGNPVSFDIELKRAAEGAAGTALAPQDKLAGRWTGTIKSFAGEFNGNAVFRKTGDQYVGTVSSSSPDQSITLNTTLKNIKMDGDKLTAVAEVEAPNRVITINLTGTLKGNALIGQGSADVNGNSFTFDLESKREAGAATPTASTQAQAPRQQRAQVPQPQQKQSADYFVGQWTFKYIGRESALGLAPREGTMTVTKNADGKTLEARTTGKAENGAFQESATIVWDEATKMLTYAEKLSTGVKLQSKADWTSPISIRFTIDPVKVKGQTFQLRRTISVIAAHSFSVTEELSEDGGPFIRLGNAVYTKVGATN